VTALCCCSGSLAALRRSELVALDVEDLAFDATRGLKVTIRTSKTDQQRAGAMVAVPYARAGDSRCAVHALRVWLDAANIHRGPVFRRMHRGDTVGQDRLTDQSVALIIKRRGQAAGISPEDLSGHSLRAGHAAAAAAARRGAQDRQRHAPQEPPRAAQVGPPRVNARETTVWAYSQRAPPGHPWRTRRAAGEGALAGHRGAPREGHPPFC
jgi:integrase